MAKTECRDAYRLQIMKTLGGHPMYSVMLVDDEQFTRQGLRSLIDWQSCGYEVILEADNGEDALALINQQKPDLVITDIRMPVLDGLELIRAVYEQNDRLHAPTFIIISGYNDFKYAQQAVRYGVHDFILKPIDKEEMTETLVTLSEKLKLERQERKRSEELLMHSMIETLIMGEANDELFTTWERSMHHAQQYQYMFIELNDVHPWSNTPAVTPTQFKQYTTHKISQLLPNFESVYLHEHRGRLGIITTNVLLDPYRGNASDFVRDLQAELERQFGKRIFIYSGEPVEQLSLIHESYKSAKELLQYKYIFDESRMVTYEQVQHLTLNYIEADSQIYKQLLEQLEEENTQEMEETITQLFHDFQKKCFAPEAIKMNIHQSVSLIVRTIKELDGDEQELNWLEPIVSWHDLNLSLHELKKLFLNFVYESSELIKRLRKENAKGSIHKIKSYIESNFHRNISLKSISAEFYMNSVYLGQLFKKHYGMYFNEYLLSLRVDEAKKLLRQTDLRIYEIAERVGFKNADYFVTQFEKLEGMTPSEYRSKLDMK